MKIIKFALLILVTMLPLTLLAQEELPAYDNLDSPIDLLASYYNAIERNEFARAYGYWGEWGSAPLEYSEFVVGFSETTSIQLIVQPPIRVGVAAGSAYVEIPTVLLAEHKDNTSHVFAGCFVTRRSNLQPPAIPEEDVWHLYSADIIEIVDEDYSIPTLLAEACEVEEA